MTILVLAPHADDEVLGMGGTIARFSSEGRRVVIAVLTGHGEEKHPLWKPEIWDLIRAEAKVASAELGVAELLFRELPAACLDNLPAWRINQVVTDVVREVQPEEIYIPFIHDLHQDHQAIAYAATVACRPYLEIGRRIKRVLAYETLSETHLALPYLAPPFQPNVFVDISDCLEKKLDAMRAYASQLQSDHLPRSLEALRALARLRGTHIGVEAAEAFVLLRESI
ncbi:PIG-L deacetylase family protein [Malikia spinosa]|uniref:PIG-L family deacetylase n=1 Tax=Malikia spinosa TaxID=86180 RepID=A0A7C9JMU9_9BURK|nr:PIG-L deacetylase family protein [Malikia spinosa]MYZ53006.1 PIG-L family deacetylase [Malikia spinosa]